MRKLLIVFIVVLPFRVALAQEESWRSGLRIIPWVADGYFDGGRYQTTVVVSLTAAHSEHPETTCTLEAVGVELVGPSGKRSSKHNFQLFRSAGPRVWSAKTPSDSPLATGYAVVDCTIEAGEVPGLFSSFPPIFTTQEIEAYSTFALFSADSELKSEAAVFSSDCRFWASQLFVDTTGGARMAVAVANHREDPETVELTVEWGDDEDAFEEKSLPLPGKAPKAFFLDEVFSELPEEVPLRLLLRAESRRPLGAVGLRYTDGTFSTVPFWPIELSPRQPGQCGDGSYGGVVEGD